MGIRLFAYFDRVDGSMPATPAMWYIGAPVLAIMRRSSDGRPRVAIIGMD